MKMLKIFIKNGFYLKEACLGFVQNVREHPGLFFVYSCFVAGFFLGLYF